MKITEAILRHKLAILLLLVLATRVYPLIRGSITNLETLNTMLVIKQFALGNTGIFFNESWLQVYLITMPYALLKAFMNVSETLYLVKALLVTVSAFVVYLFGKMLTGRDSAGYLALILFASSPLAIYSQSLGVWSGDVIASVLLSASVLLLLYAIRERGSDRRRSYIYAVLSVAVLVIADKSWNGGVYTLVTYAFTLLALAIWKGSGRMSKTLLTSILLIALAFTVYIPSQYNIGVFNAANYQGGIRQTVTQFLANNDYSLYGSGAVTNPINIKMSAFYYALLPIGFFTSTFLVAIAVYFFTMGKGKVYQNHAFLAVAVMYAIGAVIAISYRRFDSLAIIPIAILSGAGLDLLLSNIKTPRLHKYAKLAFAAIILMVFAGSVMQVAQAGFPTDLTVDYLSTMKWISTYTPPNATFLTNVFDEAPIEYFGNRASAIDGWNGGLWQFPANASVRFDNFLFSPSCNSTYLRSTGASYLVVDSFWLYPGYVRSSSVNGTNLQNLATGGFNIGCGNLTLALVYESGDNITRVYKIENSTVSMPGRYRELVGIMQAGGILSNNFTYANEPTISILHNDTYGNVTSASEELLSKNGSYKVKINYAMFNTSSDAAAFYLYSISVLRNSMGVGYANVGTLFNATYVYVGINESSVSVLMGVYDNYFIYLKSEGRTISEKQAKQLLYNQMMDMHQYCRANSAAGNSIVSLNC